MASGLACHLLLVIVRSVNREQSSSEFVMMLLVRLNDFSIKGCRFVVAASFTEVDEALIANQCNRLPCKLARCHSGRRALKLAQVFKQRRVSTFSRVNCFGINAKSFQPVSNQAIVPGLIAGLPGERELHVELRSCGHPYRGQFTRLEFILEGDPEKTLDSQLLRRFPGSAELAQPLE